MTPGRSRLGAVAVAVALLAGCAQAGTDRAEPPPAAATTRAPETATDGVDAARDFRSARGYQATPVPVRLEIARIGVSTGLQRLGRAADGTVEVPTGPHRWDTAGWYAGGTRPGDPGSAVILGHVDSTSGPAVFSRLRQLRPGDKVEVVRADGSRVRFAVERVAQYDKARFPTDEVYYPTLTPALRLVTCGGEFDATVRHYRSNVIVFATLEP
jgi:hypothetical protein